MYLAAVAGGSSRNDAVAGAASTVLLYLYPHARQGRRGGGHA